MDLNILIRSAWLAGTQATARRRGLVVDSIAEAELEETRAKARGLLRALGSHERARAARRPRAPVAGARRSRPGLRRRRVRNPAGASRPAGVVAGALAAAAARRAALGLPVPDETEVRRECIAMLSGSGRWC
jgi:hypothetical protein